MAHEGRLIDHVMDMRCIIDDMQYSLIFYTQLNNFYIIPIQIVEYIDDVSFSLVSYGHSMGIFGVI
jgi:hypothetical protein